VLSEPRDTGYIEVVGGLIQEEDVPLLDKKSGERYSPALASTEVTDASIPGDVREQTLQYVANLGISGPLVFSACTHHSFGNGEVGGDLVALIEHPHPQTFAGNDRAPVGGEATGEKANQGGLAVTVAADNSDAIAIFDTDRHGFENNLCGVFEVEVMRPE